MKEFSEFGIFCNFRLESGFSIPLFIFFFSINGNFSYILHFYQVNYVWITLLRYIVGHVVRLIPVPCPELPCPVIWLITISAITMRPAFLHLWTMLMKLIKVIYPKYWISTVAHTFHCVCIKLLNHGLNNGLLFSFLKCFGWKNILN